jgi:poly-beta-1,6-N-acetyl-D-glucosamine synthase
MFGQQHTTGFAEVSIHRTSLWCETMSTAQQQAMADYIVISPVKDEEKFIDHTISSVCQQTVRPTKWIIVDDGSSDRTPQIIEKACSKYDWIVNVRIARDSKRQLGSAEIRAFQLGYRFARDERCGFVVKLDGDLDLPKDYFERLLARFRQDERLGIASGVYLENNNGQWKPNKMPAYHAAGAAKMVRAECFRDIGGFPLSPGWDTADEIKAWARGWKTQHFPEIQFHHLKPEGSMQGAATHLLHGEVYYVCGGGKLFLLLKVIERMVFGKPLLLGGALLLCGYLRAAVTSRPKLVSGEEAKLYRELLDQRVTEHITKLFRR